MSPLAATRPFLYAALMLLTTLFATGFPWRTPAQPLRDAAAEALKMAYLSGVKDGALGAALLLIAAYLLTDFYRRRNSPPSA